MGEPTSSKGQANESAVLSQPEDEQDQQATSYINDLTQAHSFQIQKAEIKPTRSRALKIGTQTPTLTVQCLTTKVNEGFTKDQAIFNGEINQQDHILSPLMRKHSSSKKKEMFTQQKYPSAASNYLQPSKQRKFSQPNIIIYIDPKDDYDAQSSNKSIQDIFEAQLKDIQSNPEFRKKRTVSMTNRKKPKNISVQGSHDNMSVRGLNDDSVSRSAANSPYFKPGTIKPQRRRDQNGVRIIKGSKNHKISFTDQAQNLRLEEVFIVESYKEYYQKQDNYDSINCTCSIY
ncbi:UNKNOWN [Stylonychia lemnae]|uniref:Uncharacterized protein n=1 Tax=Stylonychia lemnae TaxID=5949 RepID=A0A078B3X9_STYLE|nr:UNKNOWN [Stylonychia lemnae]|eukprot:CDW87887.1 UNKNOWN [Stylonychia lemnae]